MLERHTKEVLWRVVILQECDPQDIFAPPFGREASGSWVRSRKKLVVMKAVICLFFCVFPGQCYPLSRVVLKLGSSTEDKDPIRCLRNRERIKSRHKSSNRTDKISMISHRRMGK